MLGAALVRVTTRESELVDDDLTPAQIREIERRLADYKDPTRYLLVSQIGPRFALYYNVTDDVFARDPRGGTLFKRRRAALAVKALLRPGISVLTCRSKRIDGVPVPILGSGASARRAVPHMASRPSQPTSSVKQRSRGLGRRISSRRLSPDSY
jgi:hypothetical protein